MGSISRVGWGPIALASGFERPIIPNVPGGYERYHSRSAGDRLVFPWAGVAQLVEHDVANVVVVGSNPIARSIFISAAI